jgi:hypothetical protein
MGLLTPVEQEAQKTFGMVPMDERLSILPRYSSTQGLIAPQFIYDLAKAFVSPYVAMQGRQVTPEETLNTALSTFGGSAVGVAPKGSLRSGFQRVGKGEKKTEFEIANEIAQKNATEMLGLPPNNTAMDRARALGYDMTMYHGTDVPFIDAFDPKKTKIIEGVFSTNNPKTGSKYAEEAGLKNRAQAFGMESSPNVLPLLIKSESHTRIPKFDKETIDRFRSYGNKGVYRDEMGVAVTFDPSQIRSRFAAFDPARINEANLLAMGGSPLPLGLLLNNNKEKKPKK